jgi:hypothetical protein
LTIDLQRVRQEQGQATAMCRDVCSMRLDASSCGSCGFAQEGLAVPELVPETLLSF